MVRVERKINKKIIISLILLVALAFLVVASVLLNVLGENSGSSSTSSTPPLEVLDGEASKGKFNYAYPLISESQIYTIEVLDKTIAFKLERPDENGDMELWYTNENGEIEHYTPNILYTDSSLEYSSLYAIDTEDTLGIGMGVIPLISLLCSAVGTTAFQERIELSEKSDERAAQLESFGFTEDECVTMKVTFTDSDENAGDATSKDEHTLKIGKRTVAGAGRYFMVDDRDFIYCSYFDYFEYGLQGFTTFVKPYIVTEGMSGDNGVLAAYLIQDFSQWRNTLYESTDDIVVSDSQVIVDAQVIVPSNPWASGDDGKDAADGYRYDGYKQHTFSLADMKDDPIYSRLFATLVGKNVGKYYDYSESADDSSALVFTLIPQSSDTKDIAFGDKESVKYEYTIQRIEAVLNDTAENSTVGTPVGENKLIKVAYSFRVDGVEISNNCHAILDLNDEGVPEDVRRALSESKVGDLEESIEFSVDYTKENARKYEIKYVICDILDVYDKDGNRVEDGKAITADSTVRYRYYLEIDGEPQDEIYVDIISLADPETDEDQTGAESDQDKALNEKFREILREKLVGKKVANDIKISVMSITYYNEIFHDFETYKVAEICYFVTSELVTSFGYVNASDQDPFTAESYYGNKMEDKNKLYGINFSACYGVVQYFMGVVASNSTSTSSSATGLSGDKTVAIGLTPQNMKKYGLYDYKIHIELPRGISERQDEAAANENDLSNYRWDTTVSFTLYISREQPDGTRYVGSDMYDIIAVIDGEMFKFLEYNFAEFWARRKLFMVDYLNIENMKLQFNMDELQGNYSIGVTHGVKYIDENGRETTSDNENATQFNVSNVLVSQSGECKSTVFSQYLADNGLDSILLSDLYDNIRGDGSKVLMGEKDYLGSANYREFIYLLFGISYTDYISDLTDEQKSEIKNNTPMMRMSVQLDRQAYSYTYDFHRIDDRRIMVTLYRTDAEGNRTSEAVSDFYISTFAFKKIVRAFFDVLNVKTVDIEVGYPKED